jgi:hypothetical protein
MPGLPEKLIAEFEGLQEDHPYVPYGAYVKRQAEELAARGKRGQRRSGQPPEEWDILQVLSDDERRLVLADRTFAREILQQYDPAFQTTPPNAQQIDGFRRLVHTHGGGPQLFPGVQQGQGYPRFSPQETARIREVHQARLAENTRLGQQAETMLGQTSRLAPLGPLHTTAKTLLQGNNPRESLRLGREEIAAAGRTDVPHAIAPYLAKSAQTPAAFLRQYQTDYQPLIQNFRRESARDFLEHDLPAINNQFASRGAFHSGARQAALDNARADKERRIEQEVSKLLVHGHEQGMKNFHEHRHGHLKEAEIAGHAHQAKQDSRLRAAEALRVNSSMEQAGVHGQVAALEQLGRTEQQQAQSELNVRQQEHAEEMERPFLRQIQKSALPYGIMQPVPRLSPESINPPPPNVYGMGAGLLGQMAGLMGQQQQVHHAKGGHVRRGYAAGDSVARAASQLQQMRGHIQESPEEAEMRQSAQGFKNYRANPMADYLFAAGSHQLANLGGSPMKAYGEGAQLGMQAYKAAQGANLSAQEKYHNLMDKINQTKMNQHQFLAQYHSKIQDQEEASRYHMAHHGENIRHHKTMEEERKRAVDLMGSASTGTARPGKMSATEKKLENDAKKDLLRSLRMKKELSHLGGLVKKTSTGPMIGSIKGILPKTNIDNQIEVGTNKLILEMHQGMKNIPRSEEFLKRIETTKPNRTNYPEANEAALNMMNQGAGDVMEHSISTLLSAGWTPEKIEKQFKIKVPAHLLEEAEGEEAQLPVSEEGEGNNISMLDLEGNPLEVPEDQVEEALSMGATIAQ